MNSNIGWRERSAQRKALNHLSRIIIDSDLNDAINSISRIANDESILQTTPLQSFRAIRQMKAQQARQSQLPSPKADTENKTACLSFENDWGQGSICDLSQPSLEIRRADQNLSDTGLDSRRSSSFSDAGCASEASTRRVRFSSTVTIKSNVLEVRPLNDEGPMKVPPFGSQLGSSPSVAARLARALSRNFQCIAHVGALRVARWRTAGDSPVSSRQRT